MKSKNVAAFWLKKSEKTGKMFMSGKIDENITFQKGDTVFLFKNDDKEGSQPDYRMTVKVADAEEAFV